MTCGIYKLAFTGTEKCYIGQSVNIEQRYTQHKASLKNNTATKKLTEAYSEYGTPSLVILEICKSDELDTKEEEYIKAYNSVDEGFNTYSTVNEFIILKGTESGNSIYSEELIIDVLMFLCVPGVSVQEAEQEYGIKDSTIHNILSSRQHMWASEKYPKLVQAAKSNSKLSGLLNKANWCKSNLSVSGKQINYPKLLCPKGIVHLVDNISEFARKHPSISKSSLHRLLSGQVRKSKGWTVCLEEQV